VDGKRLKGIRSDTSSIPTFAAGLVIGRSGEEMDCSSHKEKPGYLLLFDFLPSTLSISYLSIFSFCGRFIS
jgi:hypothetical protein